MIPGRNSKSLRPGESRYFESLFLLPGLICPSPYTEYVTGSSGYDAGQPARPGFQLQRTEEKEDGRHPLQHLRVAYLHSHAVTNSGQKANLASLRVFLVPPASILPLLRRTSIPLSALRMEYFEIFLILNRCTPFSAQG